MTHEYEGQYREKHAPETPLDPALARHVKDRATEEGRLSCAAAFAIAKGTGANPAEVGRTADLLETKITRCQLGLFGHGTEQRNIVEPSAGVSTELEQALRGGTVNGRLPCREAWNIARQWGVSKQEITAACQRLEIRIGPCQLGVF